MAERLQRTKTPRCLSKFTPAASSPRLWTFGTLPAAATFHVRRLAVIHYLEGRALMFMFLMWAWFMGMKYGCVGGLPEVLLQAKLCLSAGPPEQKHSHRQVIKYLGGLKPEGHLLRQGLHLPQALHLLLHRWPASECTST